MSENLDRELLEAQTKIIFNSASQRGNSNEEN